MQYPLEVLNTLNPLGFPAHRRILEIGIPIMLLRNLCSPKLCNGTRLHVTAVQKNVVEATIIITGCAKGESEFIPRITFIPSNYPFEFKRTQFPIKVCFAVTINKSQGQSLKVAGIDLREDCFSHGLLYVCGLLPSKFIRFSDFSAGQKDYYNVIYKEVLS